MAASADWVSWQRSDRSHSDGGTVEALCPFDDEERAKISKDHNNNVNSIFTAMPLPVVEEGTSSF
jgi:hypothetical protein